MIKVSVEPKTKADQEKMGLALNRLAKEDPSFRYQVTDILPYRPYCPYCPYFPTRAPSFPPVSLSSPAPGCPLPLVRP